MQSIKVDLAALGREARLQWYPVVGNLILWHRAQRRAARAQKEVASALRSRPYFPREEWEELGVPVALAERVSRVIKDWVRWHPNHHFLPNDSLQGLLVHWNCFSPLCLLQGLEKELGVRLESNAWPEMRELKDLVVEVNKRSR